MTNSGHWVDVGDASSVPAGELRQVEIEGTVVVLVGIDDGVVAFQGLCSHEQYPLADGFIEGRELVCALHGSTFEVSTGDVTLGPADQPLAHYTLEVADDRLRLFVPAAGLPVNE